MKHIKLSDRLRVIAGLIENGSSVADIGTDHGYLPVYLAQTGISGRIIASDISSASLDAARRSAAKYGVTESITFLVAPGLDRIGLGDIDTVVIAGMGGENIVGILRDAPWTRCAEVKLILQPQSKRDVLFRFLYDSGYEISEIKYVIDNGKRYCIVCCIF